MRAFTLIEVMIAVIIATLGAVAALNMGIQSARIETLLKERRRLVAPISIAAFHGNVEFSNTQKRLFAMLESSYKIENEALIDYLDNTWVLYNEERVSSWELIPNAEEYGLPRFEIVEKTVTLNGSSARIYQIREDKLP
ncbi:MAG: prepilin-type N-terminal cleavage/methylation domain-containing protein [Helicobacteraceae bacterium]|jgi:prepilin-type N-terminal cleavage/methylation domain-containing protein|nr:prepilin-type N-terminal cleavage/methylation domain-containing protein [Helicobacteraceae bacterium]